MTVVPNEILLMIGDLCDRHTRAKMYKALNMFEVDCEDIDSANLYTLSQCAVCHKISCDFCYSKPKKNSKCGKCQRFFYPRGTFHKHNHETLVSCGKTRNFNRFCSRCIFESHNRCLLCDDRSCLYNYTMLRSRHLSFSDFKHCDNFNCSNSVCKPCSVSEEHWTKCPKTRDIKQVHFHCNRCVPGEHSSCIDCGAKECDFCDPLSNEDIIMYSCEKMNCINVICEKCIPNKEKVKCSYQIYGGLTHLHCGKCSKGPSRKCVNCSTSQCSFFNKYHETVLLQCTAPGCDNYTCSNCEFTDTTYSIFCSEYCSFSSPYLLI